MSERTDERQSEAKDGRTMNPAVGVGAGIAIGVAVVLLVCLRPKAMLKVVGILLIFALAAYAFTLVVDMAGSGRSQKSEMIHKVE